jgi:hypothetical protein
LHDLAALFPCDVEPLFPEDVGLAEARVALIPDATYRTISAPTSFLWDNAEGWLIWIREFTGAQPVPDSPAGGSPAVG